MGSAGDGAVVVIVLIENDVRAVCRVVHIGAVAEEDVVRIRRGIIRGGGRRPAVGGINVAVADERAVHTQLRAGVAGGRDAALHDRAGGRVAHHIGVRAGVVRVQLVADTAVAAEGPLCERRLEVLFVVDDELLIRGDLQRGAIAHVDLRAGQELQILIHDRGGAILEVQGEVAVEREVELLGIECRVQIQIHMAQGQLTAAGQGIDDAVRHGIIDAQELALGQAEEAVVGAGAVGLAEPDHGRALVAEPAGIGRHLRRDVRAGADLKERLDVLDVELCERERAHVVIDHGRAAAAAVTHLQALINVRAAGRRDLAAGIDTAAVSADDVAVAVQIAAALELQLGALSEHHQAIGAVGVAGVARAVGKEGGVHVQLAAALDRKCDAVRDTQGAERNTVADMLLRLDRFILAGRGVVDRGRRAGVERVRRVERNEQRHAAGDIGALIQHAVRRQNDGLVRGAGGIAHRSGKTVKKIRLAAGIEPCVAVRGGKRRLHGDRAVGRVGRLGGEYLAGLCIDPA